jgi:hypothetical protein
MDIKPVGIITGAITNSRFADNWMNDEMVVGDVTDTTFTGNIFYGLLIDNTTDCIFNGNRIANNIDIQKASNGSVFSGNICNGITNSSGTSDNTNGITSNSNNNATTPGGNWPAGATDIIANNVN